MARFDLEFPFQSLEISIKKSKNWNGNSMAKRAIFPVFGLENHYGLKKDRTFVMISLQICKSRWEHMCSSIFLINKDKKNNGFLTGSNLW